MKVGESLQRATLCQPKRFFLSSNATEAPNCSTSSIELSRRKTTIFSAASLFTSLLNFNLIPQPKRWLSPSDAFAALQFNGQDEEDRIVRIFQETYPCVVFIKELELVKKSKSTTDVMLTDDRDAKVVGTGSGFIWDKFGHIVTNYHVMAKLATDRSGLQRCKVSMMDAEGNRLSKEAQIVGFDPSYDLAVLKVELEGLKLKPIVLGTSKGQSCYAIGNPYGYENTLSTGVVSGLGREVPSPNGQAIRGAIQTDAAINAGNSGGPLIDSYGHIIGVNTSTFTRKGTGLSSGANFAVPIDTVVRIVPYLIIYGTPYSNRY